MSTPLLTTKLYIPPPRPNLVSRPRLIERLDEGMRLGHKLTLVSAPAGFGKTTLINEWIHRTGAVPAPLQVAWLSLDAGDNDLIRFFTYLVATLQKTDESIGRAAQSLLESPQPPPHKAFVTRLVNDIAATAEPFALVLDDYHTIHTEAIHEALQFLLDHQPPQLHLVLATREDPPLTLSRLRVQGQMTELRTDDLRFTPGEAAAFLKQAAHLNLTPDDIAALEARTEGWIAGLQLAALSLQGRDAARVADFIADFGGSHRYVMDYLLQEVLQRQPKEIRDFLIQTVILERMSGPLCDVVLGHQQVRSAGSVGQQMLEHLEAANLFVIPLDDRREWYRYHHLFADLLRYRLQKLHADRVPELHRRAGAWYEQQQLVSEAIHHFLAAKDFQRVVGLVEQSVEAMQWGRGEFATVRNWLEQLPKELVHTRPRLCLAYGRALIPTGQLDVIEPYLRSAEVHLQDAKASASGQIEVQKARGEIAAIRASVAWLRGDLANSIEQHQRALEQLPKDETRLRSRTTLSLAEAYYMKGDVASAIQTYTAAIALGRESHSLMASLAAMARLVDLQMVQGRLRQASRTCQQMQELVTAQGGSPVPIAGIADNSMGNLLYERNDLRAAEQRLRCSIKRGRQAGNPLILLNGYITLARALQARGDGAGACEAMSAATQVEQRYQVTWTRGGPPVSAYQAWLWLVQGDVTAASQWAKEHAGYADDEISFSHEQECLILARVFTAQGDAHKAIELLRRLRRTAEAGGRTGRVIEALALEALALQAQDDTPGALDTLTQALMLAEPEGYIRLFVDEGEPMAALLRAAAARGTSSDYARKLLAAFDAPEYDREEEAPTPIVQPLVDPLSDRELEVLRLIAAGMSNQEIADKLYVTVGTVKSHNTHIFGKLGVKNRTQAVSRARALGLL